MKSYEMDVWQSDACIHLFFGMKDKPFSRFLNLFGTPFFL